MDLSAASDDDKERNYTVSTNIILEHLLSEKYNSSNTEQVDGK